MTKWLVTLIPSITGTRTIVIEADTEDEAEEIALETVENELYWYKVKVEKEDE